MSPFLTSLITTIGTSGVVIGLFIWLIKKWLSVRIENSVKSEYDIKLADYKGKLDEQLQHAIGDINFSNRLKADQLEVDRALFNEFIKEISPCNIKKTTDHWYGHIFWQRDIEFIRDIGSKWSLSNKMFLNTDIQTKFKCLLTQATELFNLVLSNIENHERKEDLWLINRIIKNTDPDKYFEVSQKIKASCIEFHNTYEDFVTFTRSLLKC